MTKIQIFKRRTGYTCIYLNRYKMIKYPTSPLSAIVPLFKTFTNVRKFIIAILGCRLLSNSYYVPYYMFYYSIRHFLSKIRIVCLSCFKFHSNIIYMIKMPRQVVPNYTSSLLTTYSNTYTL